MNGTVPGGFEAYARILHPFRADCEQVTQWWTWAELARRTGRTLHPLAQAPNLLGSFEDADVDGWRIGFPDQGRLDPRALAALVDHLDAATTRPDDVTIGIWVGWGELHPSATYAFVVPDAPLPGDESDELAGAATRRVRRQVRASIHPDVARALGRNEGLLTAGREYVLLHGRLDELADPRWPSQAGIGWREGSAGSMPQLIWPADRAWCLASEIDFDSTIVAGSRELVDAVLASPAVEALEVPEDGDLTWDGDAVNPKPGPAPH